MNTTPSQEPEYTNRLINETSPYLLQHAHNPVDWYPWGPEALERARTENKPMLLSVGYSACHWCHVMAHESFENPEVAKLMNDNFVNIKVDREERPDLDSIYMEAVQALSGRGGWPMTVFLTPDGVPFYAGTYFPTDDRYGPQMPSFTQVLTSLANAWKEKPDEVEHNANQIKHLLDESMKLGNDNAQNLNEGMLVNAWNLLSRQFDRMYGGFNSAPKFPQPMLLDFCMRSYDRFHHPDLLPFVELSLMAMASGGIYDQLGGGFHRYSTDVFWIVPHFEKMLYDNAQLSLTYLQAFQLTKNEFYGQIANEVLTYVEREMFSPEGGFYSTQDADSEGEEGKFFVWSKAEIEQILGDDAPAFIKYYGVTDGGNFEGKSILRVPAPIETVATDLNISTDDLMAILERATPKLFHEREKRVKPGLDDKILTGWNGMMLKSFAVASRVLESAHYRDIAIKNAEFLLKNLEQDGKLLRTYKDGRAKLNAYLEDYSQLIDGLLAVYEATFDLRWLDESVRLTDTMLARYWDANEQVFYDTAVDHETLVVRPRSFFDSATPSGQSVAVSVLLRLALLTNNNNYRQVAAKVLHDFSDTAAQHANGFGRLLSALDFYLNPTKEIVLVGDENSEDFQALLRTIYDNYLPDMVVMARPAQLDPAIEAKYPLLQDRPLQNNQATAYVCENYACQRPVNSPTDLAQQLGLS